MIFGYGYPNGEEHGAQFKTKYGGKPTFSVRSRLYGTWSDWVGLVK